MSTSFPESGKTESLRPARNPRRDPPIHIADLDTKSQDFCPLPPRIAEGTVIDDFTILEEWGKGGTAAVFKAYQKSRKREVALKVLSPHLIGVPSAVRRFHHEADLTARVAHPGIVPVYLEGVDGGYHFYAMKWMEGPTLAEFIDGAFGTRGEAFFREAANLFAYLASTVDTLHSNGILHRDIKPSNLFLLQGGRLVLGDFGVAVDIYDPGEEIGPTDAESAHGQYIPGTPAYMSPERFVKEEASLDPRGDVYSIGLSLYELVTGVLPFPLKGEEEIARLKLTRIPPSPRQSLPQVPLGLEAIIRQAIDIHPPLRYQTAGDLARDLARFASTRRTGTRSHPGAGISPGSLDGEADSPATGDEDGASEIPPGL